LSSLNKKRGGYFYSALGNCSKQLPSSRRLEIPKAKSPISSFAFDPSILFSGAVFNIFLTPTKFVDNKISD